MSDRFRLIFGCAILIGCCLVLVGIGAITAASASPQVSASRAKAGVKSEQITNLCIGDKSNCGYWTEGVDEYCVASKTDKCDHWRKGEAKCLQSPGVSQACRDRVAERHNVLGALVSTHSDRPDPIWSGFWGHDHALLFYEVHSKEFNYPKIHPELPVKVQDLVDYVREAVRGNIKPGSSVVVQDYSSGDHPSDALIVTINFSFLPREDLSPSPPFSLMIVTYELNKFRVDMAKAGFQDAPILGLPTVSVIPGGNLNDQYSAMSSQRHLLRVLVVQPDKTAFEQELRRAVSDIVIEASNTKKICSWNPKEALCAQ